MSVLCHSIKPTIGISLDVELDGGSLLLNSCLQIGVCAFYHHAVNPDPLIIDSWVLDQREWSIEPQQGKVADPNTMIFLQNQPGLLDYIQRNAQPIEQVIGEFCTWYADMSERYDISIVVASPASVDFAWITNLVAYYRPSWAPRINLPFSCRCLTTQLHVAEKFCGIDTRSINSPLKQHNFPENHYAVVDALRQAWIYLTLKSILREFKLNNAIIRYRIDEDQDAMFEEELDHSLPQQQQQHQMMVLSEFWVQ